MLLNVDGLDKKWDNGVRSDFEGELGWHAAGDVETYCAPLIFRRVNSGKQGGQIRAFDGSVLGLGDEYSICSNAAVEERETGLSLGKKLNHYL